MKDKSNGFLPKISEPVVRLPLGVNPNLDNELSEEELTGNFASTQGGINLSSLAIGCVIALCSPFAGDSAE